MGKIFFKTLLIALGFVLFISCGPARKSVSDTSTGKQSDIEMKVFPERNGGAPQTLDLTIKNNTGEVIQFGANYSIEHRNGNNWTEVDLGNFAVIAIMYVLQPGDSGDYNINLFTENVKYPEGDYRVVKQISVGEKDMQPYYADFKIIEPI